MLNDRVYQIVIAIISTMCIVMLLFINYQRGEIANQSTEIDELKLKKQTAENNNVNCKAELQKLNEEKKKNSIDSEKNLKLFEAEKAKMLKELNKKAGSNECEDIKNSIDSIGNTDYTRLLR